MPLIILLAFIQKQKKADVKRTLIINKNKNKEYKNRTNKKVIEFFRDFLKDYFDEIRYINFDSKLKTIKSSFLPSNGIILRTLAKSNSIKKNLKNFIFEKENIEISKVYAGGDNFEVALFNKLKKKPLFYFAEHGWGDLREGIIFSPKIKYKIYNLILKFLYKLGIINFYPIQYESYIGILSKNIKKKNILKP